jgi:hypothetical protein
MLISIIDEQLLVLAAEQELGIPEPGLLLFDR